jgi:hypothetical protein
MGRAAKNLDRQCGLNTACALFQEPNVLLFGFANAAQCRSEAHADTVFRFVLRVFNPCVIECEFCRRNGELRVTVESFQSMRRKKLFRIPVIRLAGNPNAERADIETLDPTNAGFFGQDSTPKAVNAFADASDWAKTGDDNASSFHAVTLFV